MKWIYVVIGVLVLVLIYLLIKGQSTGASGNRTFLGTSAPSQGYSEAYGSTNVAGFISEIGQQIQPMDIAEDCGQACRQLCKVYPVRPWCAERCECKRDCKSACAKGLDYKSMFP